jgi:hypothetical protein
LLQEILSPAAFLSEALAADTYAPACEDAFSFSEAKSTFPLVEGEK